MPPTVEDGLEPAALYEKFYCARGDMENRIKEQQMDLFADRTSTHWMADISIGVTDRQRNEVK